MYTIVVSIKNSPTNFRAAFKEESTAMAALENIRERRSRLPGVTITIKGDYGHIIDVQAEEIAGVLLMSIEGENAANVEGEVLKAHAEKRLNDRMRADPVLSLAAHGIPQRMAS